ncbi:GDNF family receptor alpha-1 precursor [Camelus ferus]|nr:GDNF family receptor alpha-1 precursor [Camelus ferus]
MPSSKMSCGEDGTRNYGKAVQKPSHTVEHISKGNSCLDAAKACNLDDTCKKYRSAYITPCTTSMSNEVCNRRKCHKALRQFFDKVPAKHSYGMLFCSCRDIACTERRRQTIVPVCSYEEREKPNCLNLQDSCKTNYICSCCHEGSLLRTAQRMLGGWMAVPLSRLADFFTNCQPESRSVSSCLKENYADCLLAYSGLIGTVMTPNYIDSSSLSVAPWCDCSNSGNDLEECLKFLNFFKDNTCLKNAIQAFGNGSDVTVWQPALPAQTTTATTTTAFRVKNKPLGPAGSENEIPTHVLPPCANLQRSSCLTLLCQLQRISSGNLVLLGYSFPNATDFPSQRRLGVFCQVMVISAAEPQREGIPAAQGQALAPGFSCCPHVVPAPEDGTLCLITQCPSAPPQPVPGPMGLAEISVEEVRVLLSTALKDERPGPVAQSRDLIYVATCFLLPT